MSALGCQPINEEPDAGPPVNHAPRIVEEFSTPTASLIEVLQATDSCAQGAEIDFSVGEVEDLDIDQTIQERWLLDYDPTSTTPNLGETITLQAVPNNPAVRTDPPKAYVLSSSALRQIADPKVPHVVDVFVSDGFDNVGPSDGGAIRPTDVLKGSYLVHKAWVIYFKDGSPCP